MRFGPGTVGTAREALYFHLGFYNGPELLATLVPHWMRGERRCGVNRGRSGLEMGEAEVKDGQGIMLRDGGGNERKSRGRGWVRGASREGRVIGTFQEVGLGG